MARFSAASDGDIFAAKAAKTDPLKLEPVYWPQLGPTGRVIAALCVVCMLLLGIMARHNLETSHADTLKIGQEGLVLALHLAAQKITAQGEVTPETMVVPDTVRKPGRYFLFADSANQVRASNAPLGGLGKSLDEVIGAAAFAASHNTQPPGALVTLPDGTRALIARLDLASLRGTLLAYEEGVILEGISAQSQTAFYSLLFGASALLALVVLAFFFLSHYANSLLKHYYVMRDNAQHAAAKAEAHHYALASISTAFVFWDKHDKLVAWNDAYLILRGLRPDQVHVGMTQADLRASGVAPDYKIEIDRGACTITGSQVCEVQLDDGRWLLVNCRPTEDGGTVSIKTDITSRKFGEARLGATEAELRQQVSELRTQIAELNARCDAASRLSDQMSGFITQISSTYGSTDGPNKQFLANLSHDFRTPLTHIIGFAEVIERECFGPLGEPRYLEYTRHIQDSANDLLATLVKLLQSAESRPAPRPVPKIS